MTRTDWCDAMSDYPTRTRKVAGFQRVCCSSRFSCGTTDFASRHILKITKLTFFGIGPLRRCRLLAKSYLAMDVLVRSTQYLPLPPELKPPSLTLHVSVCNQVHAAPNTPLHNPHPLLHPARESARQHPLQTRKDRLPRLAPLARCEYPRAGADQRWRSDVRVGFGVGY